MKNHANATEKFFSSLFHEKSYKNHDLLWKSEEKKRFCGTPWMILDGPLAIDERQNETVPKNND